MSDARSAAGGISGGLFLMTFFTIAWTANTFGAWPPAAAWTAFAVGLAAGVLFAVQGVLLLRAARRVPTDGPLTGRPPAGRAFGLVFGAEGLAIFLAILVLNAAGHTEYNVPVIALIVGLHFYPMAQIFHRRIDLYIATWTCLVAIAGIVVLAATGVAKEQVWAAVAVGAAVATVSYGLYLTRLAREFIGHLPAAPA